MFFFLKSCSCVNHARLFALCVDLSCVLSAWIFLACLQVLFVNSGSEANDLAWRCAKAFTGRGGALCTQHAYHGATLATVALSPETAAAARHLPSHVDRFDAPDALRGCHLDAEASFDAALARLERKGHRLAMTILDGVRHPAARCFLASVVRASKHPARTRLRLFATWRVAGRRLLKTRYPSPYLRWQVLQSDGVLVAEPAWAQALCAATHGAGGLWCADEVQGGHGRTGSHLWSFQRLGLVPDLVTLGKELAAQL